MKSINVNIKEEYNEMPLDERFWSKVNKRNFGECWEWDGHMGADGYGQFHFKGRIIHAHRMAWMIKNDKEIPEGMFVLHSCDNKRCVNPYHLRVGTRSDNVTDYMSRHKHEFGRTSRFYKGEVWLMEKLYKGGIPQKLIAKMFKTSQGHISSLINGKRGVNIIK